MLFLNKFDIFEKKVSKVRGSLKFITNFFIYLASLVKDFGIDFLGTAKCM